MKQLPLPQLQVLTQSGRKMRRADMVLRSSGHRSAVAGFIKHAFIFLLAFSAAGSVFAQTTQTWNTNTAGSNWSTAGNWSPSGAPAGNDLIFGDLFGETALPTTVGNIVDANNTLNSLTYNNTGTSGNFWQVTEISSGVTLTLDAGTAPPTIFTVGGVASASTRVAIRGLGTFTINEPTSSISVGAPTANQSAFLDMSGLSAFNANVTTVNFGTGRGNGDVTLASSNTITATTLNLGVQSLSTGNGTKSDLLLGTSNAFNVDTINVGLNFASGTVGFSSGLTNPTVTIRGSAGGSSRADMTVANTLTTAITVAQGSTVDFTGSGGSVDARIGNLIIGRRGDTGSLTDYAGTLSMNNGTIDATTVTLGQSAGTGNSAKNVTGTLNVSGGTFIAGSLNMADNAAGATSVTSNLNVSGSANVTVTGNLTAGSKSGTATTVAANINISSGTLLIQGDLAEGTGPSGVTSTVALSGGTLNMDHGTIAVDTFTMTGGTLKDVASFTAATSGGLDLQTASKLAFGIDTGFTTLGLTGTLTLGASSDLVLTLANGFTPGSSFTLVDNDAADAIFGSFATINGSAFGVGNSFSLTNDMGTFNYTLSYTGGTGNDLMAVPEPATWLLLAGVGTVFMVVRRRRQS